MIKPLVAVEDRMTEFMQPRAVLKIEEAVRDFKAVCETSPIKKDMILWKLGEYNTETGEIKAAKPEIIAKGDSYDFSN